MIILNYENNLVEDMEQEYDFSDIKDVESFVGMKIYSSTAPVIRGTIKANPSDFIVSEITPDEETLKIDLQENKGVTLDENSFNTKKIKYTVFDLNKKREDTILAAQKISKALKIPLNDVTWAGLKDNMAITVQRMCVKGNRIKELGNLNFQRIFIKNIKPIRRPIKIGNLWGNNFKIIIRNIINIDTKNISGNNTNQKIKLMLENSSKNIKEKGFPNFFGTQRFGTYRPNSHLIGKHMFLQNYKEAIEEFLLKSYPKESDVVKKCRNELKETQDFEQALHNFPKSLFYEHKMISSLIKNSSNYLKALKQLPKPLTNLLYSSYQSYLFNMAISDRVLKKDSLFSPRRGDKISILHSVNGLNSPIIFSYEKSYRKYLDKAKNMDRAVILCPIIGYKTDLTNCYFGPIYRKLLKSENFYQDDFKNSKLSTFIYKGTYRPISIKPRAFSLKFFEKTKKINSDHIILKFSLPKGTYATMLLRELIKN